MSNHDELLANVLAAGAASRRVVLDLSEVAYLDSAGVRLVFDASRELARHGVDLALVRPREPYVARLLVLTAVDQAVPTYDAAADAIAGD